MGKRNYENLYEYFRGLKDDCITTSFNEIENILEDILPDSAYKYNAWWSNDTTHSQANNWLENGYRSSNVSITNRQVTFIKQGNIKVSEEKQTKNRFAEVREYKEITPIISNEKYDSHEEENNQNTLKIVVLISCTKLKRKGTWETKLLYDKSHRFRYSYKYAKSISKDIYVISAKYGLLELYQEIESYDETLINKGINVRKEWSRSVINDLKERYDFEKTKFIILAGKKYYEFLVEKMKHYELPLEGLSQGEGLKKLKFLAGGDCE